MLSIWSLLMLKGKATPRLTLNYGVRYEYNCVWEETNVRVSNFDYATQQILPPGIPFYQPDRNDFGPRLGFAYDPFGSGKTVIRGLAGFSTCRSSRGRSILCRPTTSLTSRSLYFRIPHWPFPCRPCFPPWRACMT